MSFQQHGDRHRVGVWMRECSDALARAQTWAPIILTEEGIKVYAELLTEQGVTTFMWVQTFQDDHKGTVWQKLTEILHGELSPKHSRIWDRNLAESHVLKHIPDLGGNRADVVYQVTRIPPLRKKRDLLFLNVMHVTTPQAPDGNNTATKLDTARSNDNQHECVGNNNSDRSNSNSNVTSDSSTGSGSEQSSGAESLQSASEIMFVYVPISDEEANSWYQVNLCEHNHFQSSSSHLVYGTRSAMMKHKTRIRVNHHAPSCDRITRTPDGKIKIEHVITLDIKGWVPRSVQNTMLKTTILLRLRKQAESFRAHVQGNIQGRTQASMMLDESVGEIDRGRSLMSKALKSSKGIMVDVS